MRYKNACSLCAHPSSRLETDARRRERAAFDLLPSMPPLPISSMRDCAASFGTRADARRGIAVSKLIQQGQSCHRGHSQSGALCSEFDRYAYPLVFGRRIRITDVPLITVFWQCIDTPAGNLLTSYCSVKHNFTHQSPRITLFLVDRSNQSLTSSSFGMRRRRPSIFILPLRTITSFALRPMEPLDAGNFALLASYGTSKVFR